MQGDVELALEQNHTPSEKNQVLGKASKHRNETAKLQKPSTLFFAVYYQVEEMETIRWDSLKTK